MRGVAGRRLQVAVVEVDAVARELAAQLRVFVVEVLARVAEAARTPVDHHHQAVVAGHLGHLLVDGLADLLRNDACVVCVSQMKMI